MFYIQSILDKILKDSYKYESSDYRFQYRDKGIDDKYVMFTIYKEESIFARAKYEYQICTIGKYLRKAYNKLTPAQITHACEKYKALLTNADDQFVIVEGDDIQKYYYRENYSRRFGTLGNSCMRYKRCQNYFDIYKDHAKMLVMIPKRGKKILGRALIWTIGDKILMDRVYSSAPYIEHLFFEYAKKHKYYILANNKYVYEYEIQTWLSPEDDYSEKVKLELSINLDKEYNYFPCW